MSSWATWVFVRGRTGLEFVFHRSRTKKLSPGVGGPLTHVKCLLAANGFFAVQGHRSVPVDNNLHTTAGDPVLVATTTIIVLQRPSTCATVLQRRSSFLLVEYVVWDSVAGNSEDQLVTRRYESNITAAELVALHHELAVGPLRWFTDFATEKHWLSSDAAYQQLQGLIQIWYTTGTHDQLNFGGVAARGVGETETELR